MQFLSFYKPAGASDAPPSAEHLARINRLIEEQTRFGNLIAFGGFLPSAEGMRLRLSSGEFTLRDGGGQGSEGIGGGFGLLQAHSRDEIVKLLKEFLSVAGDGECVVYRLMDSPPTR
jgi:hypothetical protein